MIVLNTFSISARCPQTGKLGIAIASAIPCTGSISSYIAPSLGAVATQASCNPYLGMAGLAALRTGLGAAEALESVLAADPDRALRQCAVVDAAGKAAAWTGKDCTSAAGHRLGDGFAIAGNMLAGPEVLPAMEEAYLEAEPLAFEQRLLAALEAGDKAGGDKRGKQSSGLLVFDKEDFPWMDLRVDDHTAPVDELARIYQIARRQLTPFLADMPSRKDWGRRLSPATSDLLALSPAERQRRFARDNS